jgi:acetyl esterase/lipase
VLDEKLHHIHYAYELYSAFDTDMKKYEAEYSDDKFAVIPEHKVYAQNRIDRIRYAGSGGDLYKQGRVVEDKRIVAILESDDLSWLPDMTVVCGEYDFLRLQTDDFVKRALSEGVNVRSLRYLGCDHGFMEKVGVLPQAEEVLIDMAETLKNI